MALTTKIPVAVPMGVAALGFNGVVRAKDPLSPNRGNVAKISVKMLEVPKPALNFVVKNCDECGCFGETVVVGDAKAVEKETDVKSEKSVEENCGANCGEDCTHQSDPSGIIEDVTVADAVEVEVTENSIDTAILAEVTKFAKPSNRSREMEEGSEQEPNERPIVDTQEGNDCITAIAPDMPSEKANEIEETTETKETERGNNVYDEALHPRNSSGGKTSGQYIGKPGEDQPSRNDESKSLSDKRHPNFEQTETVALEEVSKVVQPMAATDKTAPDEPDSLQIPSEEAGLHTDDRSDLIIPSPYTVKFAKADNLKGVKGADILQNMMANDKDMKWHETVLQIGVSEDALRFLLYCGLVVEVVDEYKNEGEYIPKENKIYLRKDSHKNMAIRFIDEGTHALCRFILGEGVPKDNELVFDRWVWTKSHSESMEYKKEFLQCYDISKEVEIVDSEGVKTKCWPSRYVTIDPYGGDIEGKGKEFMRTVAVAYAKQLLKKKEQDPDDISEGCPYDIHCPKTVELVKQIWWDGKVEINDSSRKENMCLSPEGFLTVDACVLTEGIIAYEKESNPQEKEFEYLPKEEFNAASLETLEGVPVIVQDHVPRDVYNYKDNYTVGWVVGTPTLMYTPSGKTGIKAKLKLFDPQVVSEVKRGNRYMLSAGYRSKVLFESGLNEFGKFDKKQTNLRFNHVLIVPPGRRGRCGEEVCILG